MSRLSRVGCRAALAATLLNGAVPALSGVAASPAGAPLTIPSCYAANPGLGAASWMGRFTSAAASASAASAHHIHA